MKFVAPKFMQDILDKFSENEWDKKIITDLSLCFANFSKADNPILSIAEYAKDKKAFYLALLKSSKVNGFWNHCKLLLKYYPELKENEPGIINIRPATEQEQYYCWKNENQIQKQTGFVGYLRGDFGKSGKEFYTSWFDGIKEFRKEDFSQVFDTVVNYLRDGDSETIKNADDYFKKEGMFNSLESFKIACRRDYLFSKGIRHTARIDFDKYVFLIRLFSRYEGRNYNFYIYAYVKEYFDKHLSNAIRGVRFINSGYKHLFTIPDRGTIKIKNGYDGAESERKITYIDDNHFFVNTTCFHKSEFAEKMEMCNYTFYPALPKCGKSFTDDCIQGFSNIEELDDYIEYWHNNPRIVGSLRDFLGITEDEYSEYLSPSKDIHDLFASFIKARRCSYV